MPEITHPVAVLCTTVRHPCGRVGDETLRCRELQVPIDDAVDLSSPVWGGPLMTVHKSSVRSYRGIAGGTYTETVYSITIAAFIVEEALDAMYAVRDNSNTYSLEDLQWGSLAREGRRRAAKSST